MGGVSMPAVAGLQAGDVVSLTVGEVVHGGWCVARPEPAGPVIFVRHALPGEQVRAVITQATSRLARADAVEITAAAPGRVRPHCPHARPGGCGGCDWQHASLPLQRELKAAVIRQQLRRIAGIDQPVTVEELAGAPDGLGWRTRVRFAVRPDGLAGLRRHRSHEVEDIGACPIAHPLVTGAGVTGRRWPGARSVTVAAAGTGQRAIIVSGPGWRPGGAADADTVLQEGRPGRVRALRGSGYLTEHAAGRSWRVGAQTFWQVHPAAADTLAAAVRVAVAPQPGETALDLYCGAGLFTGMLAEAVGPAGRVIGIEAQRGAVRDARHNLRGTPWAQVRHGDVGTVLGRDGLAAAALAVLDPPRAGAGREVIDLLCAPPGPAGGGGSADGGPGNGTGPAAGSALRRIGYVSCDPATLARDLKALCAAGWRLAGLRAFDAFPMTHHVECLATLERGAVG